MVSRVGASVTAGAVLSVVLAGFVAPAVAVVPVALPGDVSLQALPEATGAPVAVLPSVEDPAPVDGTLVELPVVVPEVSGGEVEESTDIADALADDEVVAATEVVAPDRVASEVVDTTDVQTIGVTWPAESDGAVLAPQLRVQTDGQWSPWQEIEAEGEAPDPGTADAANASVRGGTEAVWIGDAEAVQLSFSAQAAPADDVSLVLVGSDEVPLPADDALVGEVTVDATSAFFATGGTVAAASSGPTVIPRSTWGARAQVCTPDVASALVGAVVHHTAGSNNYATQAEAMQQIRNDQRYHIEGRGWCDLGYNFVVDKWGNIYEGRANSVTQPVIGVHAGGFNTGTVGVSMLGTYDAAPSAATQQAVAQIIGWRLGAYGVSPQGTMTYWTGAGENSRYRNQSVTLPRVFGHRDVAYTACPGNGGYSALPAIRAASEQFSYGRRFGQAGAVVRAMYADLLGRGVDPSGLATWSGMLASGSGLPALVASLTSSDEYIRLRIAQAYREVLGREPEASGMQYWYDRIRAGSATVDDVKRRFYDSEEYFARSGGTAPGYIALLYRTMFEREASPGEASYWSAQINQIGRSRVVDSIWFSMEAALYRAGGYYQTFLQRSADRPGQENWARVLLQQGEGAVRIGIAGSEEYRRLALVRYPV